MRIKSILFLLVYFLLSCSFTLPLIACECIPACTGCQNCEEGVCVDRDYLCNPCHYCYMGTCMPYGDCGGGCPTCQSCVSCWCQCTWECCSDSDCEPEEHCELASCACVCDSGSCWNLQTVPRVDEVCPDCSGFFTACEGMIEISNSYQIWVPIGSGGYGYCKHPTKTETIGFLFECTEDWDVSEIIACAAGAGLCYYVCQVPPWQVCALCLVVEGAHCALDGICVFVEDCIPGDTIQEIEQDVVDWGADWGDFRKCG